MDGQSVEGGWWGVRGGPKFGDRNLFSAGLKFEGCSGGRPDFFSEGPEMAPKMGPKMGTEILGTEIRDRNFWGPKFGTEIKGLEKCKKHWKYSHFETEVEDRNFIPKKC